MIFVFLKYLMIFLLILLGMILFIPVYYSLEGIKKEQYFISFRISWLWKMIAFIISKEENKKTASYIGIFGFRILIRDSGRKKERAETEDKRKKEKAKKKKKKNYTRYFSLFQRSLPKKILQFVRRVLRHVLPRKYRIHLIYGCEDPADTGILAGFLAMVLPGIPHRDMILIQPVFDEEIFEGEISIQGRIVLAVIAYYALQFYFARGIRSAIRIIREK